MLKGPKSIWGDCMQKLPPSMAMSPRQLIWGKQDMASPPLTPQPPMTGTQTHPENVLESDSCMTIWTSLAFDDAQLNTPLKFFISTVGMVTALTSIVSIVIGPPELDLISESGMRIPGAI